METTSVEVQIRLAEPSAMSFARWPNACLLFKLSLDIALHLSLTSTGHHLRKPSQSNRRKQTSEPKARATIWRKVRCG